jgi:hypothetical protein
MRVSDFISVFYFSACRDGCCKIPVYGKDTSEKGLFLQCELHRYRLYDPKTKFKVEFQKVEEVRIRESGRLAYACNSSYSGDRVRRITAKGQVRQKHQHPI